MSCTQILLKFLKDLLKLIADSEKRYLYHICYTPMDEDLKEDAVLLGQDQYPGIDTRLLGVIIKCCG